MNINCAVTLLTFLTSCSLNLTALGQDSHQKAEQSIRKAVYEYSLARLNGDVKTFKMYASERSIKFYSLLFQILPDIPGAKDHFAKAGVSDGDAYLKDTFAGTARMNERNGKSQPDLEKSAKSNAVETITFSNVNDAVIVIKEEVRIKKSDGSETISSRDVIWRAVLEDGSWKIDDTDERKSIFLKMPFSPEHLAKLKKY